MYKWPQGRVIRTICLLLVLGIAADLGFNGAYGPIASWLQDESSKQLAIGIFFAIATLAALTAGIVLVGFKPLSVDFLIEVEQEMVKVEWPTSNVLVRSTIIIAIATVIVGAIIFGVDAVNYQLLNKWLPNLFLTLNA